MSESPLICQLYSMSFMAISLLQTGSAELGQFFVGLTVILNSDRDTISEFCNCCKWLSEVDVYHVHL